MTKKMFSRRYNHYKTIFVSVRMASSSPIVFYSKFKLPYLRLAAFTIIRFQNIYLFRARSHLATTTQIFDIGTMSSEMGCIVDRKKHIVVAKCERAQG